MNLEKFVVDYTSAWNRHDAALLLDLFHKDASYYDAFWMETCSGADLEQYLTDSFDEESYWYRQTGGLMAIDDGVVYRYSAHKRTDSGVGQMVFNGAEVLMLRGDKIVSASDYYCDPSDSALAEVARWAAKRHGRTRNMRHGLAAVKASRFRAQLSALMDQDKLFLDPNLTLSQIAERIGCSVHHLTQVISTEFGSGFYSFVNQHRVRYARELLLEESDDPDYVYRVAIKAGFRSFENFNRVFSQTFDVTPAEFHRDNAK